MHRWDDMGLKNIWLANGYTLHDTSYGRAVSFDDVEGLTRAVCIALARKPGKLTGAEFRYIRQAGLGMSQPSLGKASASMRSPSPAGKIRQGAEVGKPHDPAGV